VGPKQEKRGITRKTESVLGIGAACDQPLN
jgi:hypothetical protein